MRERLKEYGWLYLAKIAALVANVLLYRMASAKLGVDGFAEYSLARRSLALVLPVILAGQLVALPRMIARDGDRPVVRQSAFLGALIICLSVVVVVAIGALVMPMRLSSWFFGDPGHAGMILPMLAFMVSQALFFIVNAYHQGRMAFRTFGLVGLVLGGIAPIVGFWFAPAETAPVLITMAAIVTVLAGGLCLWILFKNARPGLSGLPIRALFSFGAPRVPGDFAMGGMLGLPSMLVANRVGLVEGGWIAFCGTMMSMAITAVAPISTAWLPRYTSLAARGEAHLMRPTAIKTVVVVLFGLGLSFGIIIPAMPWLVGWFLGEDFLPAVDIFRVFGLGLLPIAVYGCLRSIVDAAYQQPVNTYCIVASLLVFYGMEMVLRAVCQPVWAVIWAALLSYLFLALATIGFSIRPLRPGFRLADDPHSADTRPGT